ncbi:MAG: DUF1553 domain-containing protein [Bacteroidetes bacterium]|nr:DUF1553 domain-containing protein [Bacteroidota bacterium]
MIFMFKRYKNKFFSGLVFLIFFISNTAYSRKIDFNQQIKPILSDRCFKCHGPDKSKVDAELQLTSFEAATALLPSGKRAIVPFNTKESELVRRIMSEDPHELMPSPKSNLQLTAEEKKLLIQWIAEGAVYQDHWAFIPPFRYPSPLIINKNWVKTPIDDYILQKLEEKGLKPNDEATKEVIIRRLTFDLTGLPPSVEEVQTFIRDASPNAYERLVDRLLASPHFGERMALEWLDVARYADSHGYQDDGMRNTYPYRDWVIRAFNQNLSYDKFTTWQLAGDLLPNPTLDQLIATCFNRNHQQSQEGGVVPEEYRVEYVSDRVATFGKAFLGLTTECAKCHTHKYDPIDHKDYYGLFAFFNQNNESGIVPYNGEASPTVLLPTPAAQKKLDSLRSLMEPHLKAIKMTDPYKEDLEKWLLKINQSDFSSVREPIGRVLYLNFEKIDTTLIGDMITPPTKAELERRAKELEKSKSDSTIKIKPPGKFSGFLNMEKGDSTVKAVRFSGDKDKFPVLVAGKKGQGISFRGEAGIEAGKALSYDRFQPFSVSIWVKLNKQGEEGPIFNKANSEEEGFRGWACKLNKNGTLSFQFAHVLPDNAIDFVTIDTLKVGEWTHIALTYDGSSKASGIRFWLNGKIPKYKLLVDNLQKSLVFARFNVIRGTRNFTLGSNSPRTMQHMDMDELEIYKRTLSELEVMALYQDQPDLISQVIRNKTRSDQEQEQLLSYFLLRGYQSDVKRSQDSLISLRSQENYIATNEEEVMIMTDRSEYRKTFILDRGAYDAPTKIEVAPNTIPKIFPFDEDKYPKNRLGLAQWLLDEKNPLFARVAVNRFWQMLFGKGLVLTQEDFGNQGSFPTHLELLDYLALNFREKNWDVKAFLKEIVLSATYRQSSYTSVMAKEVDVSNDLYSRYPAHRLPAELVRDNALAASGLLVPQIGGPSVHPYQPEGLWEALATRNATRYIQNHGDSLYRRSLYTIWKRSSPPPSMLNFDATDRSYCAVRRQKTASPLQALVLMNDPQFVEAARILAEKMQRIPKAYGNISTESDRLMYCFQALTSRQPRKEELRILTELYENQRTYFKENEEKAIALLQVGEFERDKQLDPAITAAYTIVASTIMNFDEFLVIR